MIDSAQTMMREGAGIAIEEITGVNDNMSKSHFHTYFELYFLDDGERFHMIDEDIYKTGNGDFMIFAPLTMHHSYSDQDVEFSRVVLYFTPESIYDDALREKFYAGSGIYHPDSHLLRIIRRMLMEMMEEQANPVESTPACMQAMLNLLLCRIDRMGTVERVRSQGSRMARILAYIHQNYAEQITLRQIADEFYVSEYHLCRIFKKYTNRTLIQYLQETRVMNAERLFSETDWNVSQVAEKCGFTNLTHFNRVFKQSTGMTPMQYRKSVR